MYNVFASTRSLWIAFGLLTPVLTVTHLLCYAFSFHNFPRSLGEHAC